uniref:Protein translocase subunit SecA n=1 Tax=Cyanidium sp. THAL103 TaxID=3027999 RepID=A0A9Y1I458_9RHOD|nr:preprotein translocase subunit SecA [Cyanidium sp. THAL103]
MNYKLKLTQIKSLEANLKICTDEELKYKTIELKNKYKISQNLNELLPESFALVKEAASRVLGLKAFEVQMLGGIILNEGKIAEMKTGEGKSLAAAFPAFLNALQNEGVNIVTVNDYLAKRDAESIGQIFNFLGMTTGLIQSDMDRQTRKKNYACDITYLTNSELGFDYLKDNMAYELGEIVQRNFYYCILDEIDSILIDEARTPLIISGNIETNKEKYIIAHKLSNFLKNLIHYKIDEKAKNVILTDKGIQTCEKALFIKDLYNPSDPWINFINNSLKAKELFIRNIHYIVKNNKIMIVDEFTGRILEDRKWSDGLHQAIESKENIPIQNETKTLSSITYQNLFLMYKKLSGMTGTAKTEETEFKNIYSLEVVQIPTHKPMIRKDFPDVIYAKEEKKWQAIAKECFYTHLSGRPILVGTTNIEKSELLAKLLDQYNIKYNLLNAKPENIKRESEIIAQAGRKYSITIATNMAGRGTDIILGGNLDYFIKTLINNVYISSIDDNFKYLHNYNTNILFDPEDIKLIQKEISKIRTLNIYNKSPTKIEFQSYLNIANENIQTNNHLVKILRNIYQILLEKYKKNFENENNEVKQLGGLYVIGTERHESRRIDNQLRGRSGRQGDPGHSRFFLSLEDNLIRIFGGQQISNLMNTLLIKEDTPIESYIISNSLDNAQKKIETYFYETRKQVFDYDQILDKQRQAIYKERRSILSTKNIHKMIIPYLQQSINDIFDDLVTNNDNSKDYKQLSNYNICKIQNILGLPDKLIKEYLNKYNSNNLKNDLSKQVYISYNLKRTQIDYIEFDLTKKLIRNLLLQQIDNNWSEHVQKIAFLKELIGWRGYAQKEPLIEYKNEGYETFINTLKTIKYNFAYLIFRCQLISEQ